jgi:hypothetical protein
MKSSMTQGAVVEAEQSREFWLAIHQYLTSQNALSTYTIQQKK